MILIVLICILPLALTLQNETNTTYDVEELFKNFLVKYNRTYVRGSTEYTKRLAIFRSNIEIQNKLNANRDTSGIGDEFGTAWYGVNKFTDFSAEEFHGLYLSDLHATTVPGNRVSSSLWFVRPTASRDIPKKFDWRDRGIISKPRNQKHCGGCWAFADVETVESMYALQRKSAVTPLSVQQVLDCSLNYKSVLQSCAGGDTCTALDWMLETKVHLISESEYPLRDDYGLCKMKSYNQSKTFVVVNSTSCVSYADGEHELLALLSSYGPVSVTVDASNWFNYQGGIIQYHCGEVGPNHAVQIVGYDLTGRIPYYIIKNSWGTDFGHDGYVYVKYGANTCLVAERVSTASTV